MWHTDKHDSPVDQSSHGRRPRSSAWVITSYPCTVPTAKCLGYWWQHNLQARKSIEESIVKAKESLLCHWQHRSLSRFTLLSEWLKHFRDLHNSCPLWQKNWILSKCDLDLLNARVSGWWARILKIPHNHYKHMQCHQPYHPTSPIYNIMLQDSGKKAQVPSTPPLQWWLNHWLQHFHYG